MEVTAQKLDMAAMAVDQHRSWMTMAGRPGRQRKKKRSSVCRRFFIATGASQGTAAMAILARRNSSPVAVAKVCTNAGIDAKAPLLKCIAAWITWHDFHFTS